MKKAGKSEDSLKKRRKKISINHNPSLKEYCLNNPIHLRLYIRNNQLIYGNGDKDTHSDFMPAVVLPSAKQSSFSFTINGVSLHVDSSIEDSDLKRIIDMCSRL